MELTDKTDATVAKKYENIVVVNKHQYDKKGLNQIPLKVLALFLNF